MESRFQKTAPHAPPPCGPHPEPDELRYVEPQYDVMQLPAAYLRQSTSINEVQSKHINEQESVLRSSYVCLPCRQEGVTSVVPYKVIYPDIVLLLVETVEQER